MQISSFGQAFGVATLTGATIRPASPPVVKKKGATAPIQQAAQRGNTMALRAWKAQALGLLAIASAVAVTLVVAPGASGGHEDCTLTSGAPILFYGTPDAFTTATVECGTVKNWIRVSLDLTRDGTIVDSSVRTCHKRADCWTYVIAQDPPGDQTWCAHASARVGSHSIPEVTFCEATNEL